MDKQMIEEMAKSYCINRYRCNKDCVVQKTEVCKVYETCELLYKLGYRKIHENAVVIPKEISYYDNVEERIRTFNLDGNKVDFTDDQIMAITSIFHYKEMQAEEIRKETAEKFAERLKAEYDAIGEKLQQSYDEVFGSDLPEWSVPDVVNSYGYIDKIDEICKEITGEN